MWRGTGHAAKLRERLPTAGLAARHCVTRAPHIRDKAIATTIAFDCTALEPTVFRSVSTVAPNDSPARGSNQLARAMTVFFLNCLTNAVLALISMLVGSMATLVALKLRRPRAGSGAPSATSPEDSERTNRAIEQIRQLAEDVANDVGDHNVALEGWSDQLDAARQKSDDQGPEIQYVVSGMLEANRQLSARLEEAERKIACQADEIRTQQADARTDALTNLPNRRAFDVELAATLGRLANNGDPCSLIIFDIDHFKQFNDAHGHLAGDEVLRSVARTLSNQIRTPSTAARYGGEEFAVILPATTAERAQTAAERVRAAIEKTSVVHEGKTLRVTASIGVSGALQGDRQRDIVRRADEAVYAAKAAGRNCSYWHDGCTALPVAPAHEASSAGSALMSGKPTSTLGPITVEAASLPSRQRFVESLAARQQESKNGDAPLSLLCFSLLEFPQVNQLDKEDSVRLLCDYVATGINSAFRDVDLIGGLGRGEFIVALPGTTERSARIVGERVRTSIASQSIPTVDGPTHLEIAVAVAAVECDGSIDDAISCVRHDALAKSGLEAELASSV